MQLLLKMYYLLKTKAINKECAVAHTALMFNLYPRPSAAQAHIDEVDEQIVFSFTSSTWNNHLTVLVGLYSDFIL